MNILNDLIFISSGGSIAANALKGLFNGLIGGGEKDMISKVDLKMEMKSDIKFYV